MYDPWFPPAGYRLDKSDPDVLVLRRGDGAFVAAFSALGATREAIRHTAEADRREATVDPSTGYLFLRALRMTRRRSGQCVGEGEKSRIGFA